MNIEHPILTNARHDCSCGNVFVPWDEHQTVCKDCEAREISRAVDAACERPFIAALTRAQLMGGR